jgi:predicted ATP-dependent endonuclease of OLD family
LVSSPFPDTEDGKIEKSALRAALDFHPSVCEVFFADSTVLVEGDTEMALLKHCPQLLTSMGIDDKKVHDTSIVSCGGKWTIPAIARLLTHFEIPFKVVHDEDRKGLTDAQLAEAKPIHPFKANAKIASIVAADKIHINSDTIEDLWDSDTKSGKPYNAIVNVEEIVSSGKLNVFPALKAFITFCYS